MRTGMLIVEDERVAREALSIYFDAQGFEVRTAESAATAIAHLRRWSFAVVLTDLRLSGTRDLRGLDVVRAARQGSSHAIIVLHSAQLDPVVRALALESGADLATEKATHLRTMASQIHELVARARDARKEPRARELCPSPVGISAETTGE